MSARVLDTLSLVALCGAGLLSAALELLLVPLYAGATILPAAVLVAVVLNVVLPLVARGISPRAGVVVAPFVCWLLAVIVIGLYPRPEGDVILPGGGGALQWTGYGVLFGGVLAGTLAVVFAVTPRHRQDAPR